MRPLLALPLLLLAASAAAQDKQLHYYEFAFDYSSVRMDQYPPLADFIVKLARYCGPGCAELRVVEMHAMSQQNVPGSERLIKLEGRFALEDKRSVLEMAEALKAHDKRPSKVGFAGSVKATLGLAASVEGPCRVETPLGNVKGPAFMRGGYTQHQERRPVKLSPAARAFVPPQSDKEKAWVCADGKPLVPVESR